MVGTQRSVSPGVEQDVRAGTSRRRSSGHRIIPLKPEHQRIPAK
jgi:hypothetical protein